MQELPHAGAVLGRDGLRLGLRRGLDGRLRLEVGHDRPAPAHVEIQVHGDHVARAEGPAHGDRDRIDERTVEQPAAVDLDGAEDAGKRVGGAHGIDDAAARQPDLVPGADLGGNGREAGLEVLDVEVAQVLVEPVAEALAVDEAGAGEIEIEVAEDSAARKPAGKALERAQVAASVTGPDHGADRRADDDVGFDTVLGQRPDDTDVRPAACRSAPQRQPDLGLCH